MNESGKPVSLFSRKERSQLSSKQLAVHRYVFLILVALHVSDLWEYSGLYSTSTFEVFSMPLRIPALVTGIAGCLALYFGTIVLFIRPERSRIFFAISFLSVGISAFLWSNLHGRLAVPIFATALAGLGWLYAGLFASSNTADVG
jgi:hypothetical protein